ncbi:MAG: hypothetical protein GY787_24380, partial [Alteromonadales bacterium]|nr:hypothetical protein [Alteromonadales bacterium]
HIDSYSITETPENKVTTPQALSALHFLKIGTVMDAMGSGKLEHITGHSLGGGLAGYLGLYTGIKTSTFNAAPIPFTNASLLLFVQENKLHAANRDESGLYVMKEFKHASAITNLIAVGDPVSYISEGLLEVERLTSDEKIAMAQGAGSEFWLETYISMKEQLNKENSIFGLDHVLQGETFYLPIQNDDLLLDHSIGEIVTLLEESVTPPKSNVIVKLQPQRDPLVTIENTVIEEGVIYIPNSVTEEYIERSTIYWTNFSFKLPKLVNAEGTTLTMRFMPTSNSGLHAADFVSMAVLKIDNEVDSSTHPTLRSPYYGALNVGVSPWKASGRNVWTNWFGRYPGSMTGVKEKSLRMGLNTWHILKLVIEDSDTGKFEIWFDDNLVYSGRYNNSGDHMVDAVVTRMQGAVKLDYMKLENSEGVIFYEGFDG